MMDSSLDKVHNLEYRYPQRQLLVYNVSIMSELQAEKCFSRPPRLESRRSTVRVKGLETNSGV